MRIKILLFALTVICVSTVFTIVMLVLKLLWCRLDSRIDSLSTICHLSDFLKNYCIVNCLVSIFAPCKWSMVFAKNSRNSYRIKISCIELANDKFSRILFICILNLVLCKTAYTWNFTINIISVCCSIAWN